MSLLQQPTGAAGYSQFTTVTTDADDQSLQNAAEAQDTRESTADETLARDLGVPSATATT